MVKVFNKSNRPLGVAGKAILPDQEVAFKDKEVFCEVYDEDGFSTGERQIIPGLRILEIRGLCNIKIEEEKKVEKKTENAESGEEKKIKRSRAKKVAEE